MHQRAGLNLPSSNPCGRSWSKHCPSGSGSQNWSSFAWSQSGLWQNQSELHRLKYASPLLRATSCFKRYNFLACRVTSRYTTENRIKQGTSHEGESRDINAFTLYITGRYITYAYKSNISVQRGTLLQNGLSFKSQQRSLKTRTLYTLLLQISC
jgi:hypothetical protein